MGAQPKPRARNRRRANIATLIACCVAIPLGASTASTAQTSDLVAHHNAPSSPGEPISVAQAFEDHVEPLAADYRNANLAIPATAVDLSTFEPPIEVPPPLPTGGSVIRSLGTGVASYYGRRFHGRLTANGERFDMNAMTAAHKTLPFGTLVRVTNPRNGRSVTVRINDRGPFIRGRTIDLSRGAAERIGLIASGHARVELAVVR